MYVYFPSKILSENCSFMFIQGSNCQQTFPDRLFSCPLLSVGSPTANRISEIKQPGAARAWQAPLVLLTVCHRQKWWLQIIYQKISASSYLGQSRIAFLTVFLAPDGFRKCPEFQLVAILTTKKSKNQDVALGSSSTLGGLLTKLLPSCRSPFIHVPGS